MTQEAARANHTYSTEGSVIAIIDLDGTGHPVGKEKLWLMTCSNGWSNNLLLKPRASRPVNYCPFTLMSIWTDCRTTDYMMLNRREALMKRSVVFPLNDMYLNGMTLGWMSFSDSI